MIWYYFICIQIKINNKYQHDKFIISKIKISNEFIQYKFYRKQKCIREYF